MITKNAEDFNIDLTVTDNNGMNGFKAARFLLYKQISEGYSQNFQPDQNLDISKTSTDFALSL